MSGAKRKPWRLLCLLAAALVLLGTALSLLYASKPLTADAPSPALLAAAKGLDSIVIEAVFSPEHSSMEVCQQLTLQNRAETSRDAVVLRTWPNAFSSLETSPCASEEYYERCYPDGFSIGALTMSSAQVSRNGGAEASVAYRYQDQAKTVLTLPLAKEWLPGESLVLSLRYTLTIPHAAYRFGEQDGIWALGSCFAIPSPWQDGAYRSDEYLPVGDPFVSDCANYTVSVTVPAGMICAGSGYPTVENAKGQQIYRFQAPAVRDFALVVSDRFHLLQSREQGVLVSAYAASAAQGREMLRYAKQALRCFGERYGAYPYPSLTLAQIDFPMGGMEYPALVMIAKDLLNAGGASLEYVVAHEVAHQWWYALVGSDSVNQAWQDEALCEFSLLEYVQTTYGSASREELEQRRVESALRVTVPHGVTPGAPLERFESMSEYSLVVYNRGAALFCALDRATQGELDAFLKAYAQRYAFGFATRQDFEALLAEQTGEDYTPLMTDYLDTYILH
ncbi:MAG: M1 family metallopeptidase [Clostridia bacterium]